MSSKAKMSFDTHQNGKLGSFMFPPAKEMEISHDLHIKMSKKIAQLTKVIYALNTKNDESDFVIQTLKDQHEEEKQRIVFETHQKEALCNSLAQRSSDLQSASEALRAQLADCQAQHASVLDQLSEYKAKVKENQQEQEARHLQLSQEATQARSELEEHLNSLSEWKERVREENEAALSQLCRKHQSELDILQRTHSERESFWSDHCSQNEAEHKQEVQELLLQMKSLKEDSQNLIDCSTAKLSETTALYEKEIDVLKQRQSGEINLECDHWKGEVEKLNKVMESRDKQMNTQIAELENQLLSCQTRLKQTEQNIQRLEAESVNARSESAQSAQKLEKLERELTAKTSSLTHLQSELNKASQQCSHLQDELTAKSGKVKELEVMQQEQTTTIKHQLADIDRLTGQVRQMETARQSYLADQNSHQMDELQHLRQALQDMKLQKSQLQNQYIDQIENLQKQLDTQKKEHTEQLLRSIHEAELKHAGVLLQQKQDADQLLESTKQEMLSLHEAEKYELVKARDSFQQEAEETRAELSARLSQMEAEMKELERLVQDKDGSLGHVSQELSSHQRRETELTMELQNTLSELRAAKTSAEHLQQELDRLQAVHASDLAVLKKSNSDCIHKLAQDMDLKWADILNSEVQKTRHELVELKGRELRTALSELSQLKEEELATVRTRLESNIERLTTQIEDLQMEQQEQKSQADVEGAKLRYELEKEKSRLERQKTALEEDKSRLSQELLQAAQEHSHQMVALTQTHAQLEEQLRAQLNQDKMELEQQLKDQHMQELQAQLTAHRAALDAALQLEQRQKNEALQALSSKHRDDIEELTTRLEHGHKQTVEDLQASHLAELKAAGMELGRTLEIGKQKERDLQMSLEDMRGELDIKSSQIRSLEGRISKLQEETSRLNKEIQVKVTEVEDAKKEAKQQLRWQEEKLIKRNREVVENLKADHLQEQQLLLTQFSSAQDLLNSKISDLHRQLEEAEERFARRESRPEDLRFIETLKVQVTNLEAKVKTLIEEKKFYQLELVNRETNFNKVFNASPNVGILNPFLKPKIKGDKSGKVPAVASIVVTKGSGASHQKLDPLPGSPLHDELLNPARPLPQPAYTKKVM